MRYHRLYHDNISMELHRRIYYLFRFLLLSDSTGKQTKASIQHIIFIHHVSLQLVILHCLGVQVHMENFYRDLGKADKIPSFLIQAIFSNFAIGAGDGSKKYSQMTEDAMAYALAQEKGDADTMRTTIFILHLDLLQEQESAIY